MIAYEKKVKLSRGIKDLGEGRIGGPWAIIDKVVGKGRFFL